MKAVSLCPRLQSNIKMFFKTPAKTQASAKYQLMQEASKK
jgi:hypothetical protein